MEDQGGPEPAIAGPAAESSPPGPPCALFDKVPAVEALPGKGLRATLPQVRRPNDVKEGGHDGDAVDPAHPHARVPNEADGTTARAPKATVGGLDPANFPGPTRSVGDDDPRDQPNDNAVAVEADEQGAEPGDRAAMRTGGWTT